MKKFFTFIVFALIPMILFSEDLKSVMGIEFGVSLPEAERLFSEKGWNTVYSKSVAENNIGIQKKYTGGMYGGITDLELQAYFLKDNNSTALYKIEFSNSERFSGSDIDSLHLDNGISKFSDILEALLSKYDWKTTEGAENIRNLVYTKKKPTNKVSYIDKQNSSMIFVRTESRYAGSGFYSRTLKENMTFTYEPINSIYEKKLEEEQQRAYDLKQKQESEKEKLRLEQINNLKDDL